MTITEIVIKLVGDVDPVGETYTDDERFKNLETLCELIGDLTDIVGEVAYSNIHSLQYSKSRAGEYANKKSIELAESLLELKELNKKHYS